MNNIHLFIGQRNFLCLALDPFPISTNGNNLLNLTEGNIAVIPCELPKGNPRPIPVFSLDNNQIEIQLHSSMFQCELLMKKNVKILSSF